MVITYGLPDPREGETVIRRRLGPLAKGLPWNRVDVSLEGLSHADLVKTAEAAAKQALMRGDERVDPTDLADALTARRAASLG
jgi:hypothetical protein